MSRHTIRFNIKRGKQTIVRLPRYYLKSIICFEQKDSDRLFQTHFFYPVLGLK